MVKLSYSILYVADVEKSIVFYENTFGFSRKFITPENDYGELDTGNTTLSFASIQLAESNLTDGFQISKINEKPFAFELGFTTDNVEALVEKAISCGAILVEKPRQKPWGQIVAYVRDLDGFLLEICTPM